MSDNPFIVPPQGYYFCTGCSTLITWQPTTFGTVTISLMDMSSPKSPTVAIIAMSIPNSGSYIYKTPDTIPSGTKYMLEIVDDSDHDKTTFSPQFAIENLNAAASGTMSTMATDMSAMPSSSSSSMPSMSMSSAASSTMSMAAMTSSAAPSHSHKSLSTGADVGIAIGSAIIVLILVAAAFFLGRRKLTRKRNSQQHGADMVRSLSFKEQPQRDVKPRLEPMRPMILPTELDGDGPQQMSEHGTLATMTPIPELESPLPRDNRNRLSELPSPPPGEPDKKFSVWR